MNPLPLPPQKLLTIQSQTKIHIHSDILSHSIIHSFTQATHFNYLQYFSFLPPNTLKADTPIEEFTPTPAFPALQYLESVDEGGVAWEAGLRTGDFLIEVRHILKLSLFSNPGIQPKSIISFSWFLLEQKFIAPVSLDQITCFCIIAHNVQV